MDNLESLVSVSGCLPQCPLCEDDNCSSLTINNVHACACPTAPCMHTKASFRSFESLMEQLQLDDTDSHNGNTTFIKPLRLAARATIDGSSKKDSSDSDDDDDDESSSSAASSSSSSSSASSSSSSSDSSDSSSESDSNSDSAPQVKKKRT